ncbi:MAG: SdpI family protein [Candidatus Cloacimonetes bacterium]|nr:SdpI family protein [Candidatus Cloacimonadota bacterium]
MNKKFWISIIIIIIQLVLALYLSTYIATDARIPSHWNIKGEIDSYTGKWTGILLFPGINLSILLIMFVLPYISVRYKNAKKRFSRLIPLLTNMLIFFFAVIHIYTLLIGAEVVSAKGCFIYYTLGLLFILLGNILPKVPSNFFIGIRTPWTLSSESVWRKTHKVGGLCFVLAGLLMIIIPAIWGNNATAVLFMFIIVMLLMIYAIIYSFILYKKEQN